MTATSRTSLLDIADFFSELQEPRSHINLRHPLTSVIVIAVMAILAGANGPTAIARWADVQRDFLTQALSLPHGVPGKDVFRTVLSLLKPELFQACFANWIESLKLKAMQEKGVDRPILNIDGKTARRSHDRANGLGALHAVTVWADELGLSLGQVACDEKSNEITAIPQLLRLIDVTGAIITIDAMGTQKALSKQLLDVGADYVLALKGNQETLHDAVIDLMDQHLANDFADIDARHHSVTETLHGHSETRLYTQVAVPKDLPMLEQWPGLKTIGVAVRCYGKNGEEYSDVRYFISSLPMGVKQFALAVRKHWGIENSCHWTLDMTFREDLSRIRGEQIRENCAWLSRFALSLLKQHPAKLSIALKRQSCGWSTDFLLQVLTGFRT